MPAISVEMLHISLTSDAVYIVRQLCTTFEWQVALIYLRKKYIKFEVDACIQSSAFRIVSNSTRYTSITPVLKKLHCLPIEQHTVFQTVSSHRFSKVFTPYLSSYSSYWSTRSSQSGGEFLVIPKFYPSVHKSVKQFYNSFTFYALAVWNALPDEICASSYLAFFRKQFKTYLYTKACPP